VIAKRCLAASMAMALVLLAACGGGSSSAVNSTSDVIKSTPSSRAGALPASTCINAKIDLGRGGGEIRFSVACRASRLGHRVGFSLARSGLGHFSRHPAITGLGAENRYGSCKRRLKEVIDCEGHLNGKAEIAGVFAVDPQTRCASDISVTVAEPSRCTGKDCPASLVVRQIFRGLPAGC